MFNKAKQLIEQYDTIIIHRHIQPDGDAIGSQVGLKHIILANYPTKHVYMVGDDAGRYSFMADSVMDTIDDSIYDNALAIIVDTAPTKLISDHRYTLAQHTLRFDHHNRCEDIAMLDIIDTSYESCAGLITDFAITNNLIIPDISATSLYTGMITDSGRFRYDSTTSRTLSLASNLMQHNIDTTTIYRNLYADNIEGMRLRAQYTLKIQFTTNNVGYIYTTKEELDATGQDTFAINRGMVGTMSDIKGVNIWVNFTEDGEKVLCELRSSLYNINPIAVKYGGGGHNKASGATVQDRKEAMAMLADLDILATTTPQ